MFMTSLLTITPWPVLSAAILLVLLIAALYLARHTAHQAIHSVTSALARGFRLVSHSVAHAEERLAARNREVLLNAGRDAKERMVEREFARIADTTRKDLSNYPDMHRRLSEAIIRIEEDQEKAVEVPPEAPGWAKAVEVIAKLDARNAGAEILADIHKSMLKAHAEAMVDYRKASGERHGLLRKMMPDWRLIQETLGRVNKSVASVIERSLVIDRHMQDYETIVRSEEHTSELQSRRDLVCRLLLEKKKPRSAHARGRPIGRTPHLYKRVRHPRTNRLPAPSPSGRHRRRLASEHTRRRVASHNAFDC